MGYRHRNITFIILLMLCAEISLASENASSIMDLLTERYNNLKSLIADFAQSFESKALGRGIEEKGKLYIEIPGKMRWEYLLPEKKLAICNGSDTWLYIEEDNTVIKGNLDTSNNNIAIVSLLSGRADLNEIFNGEVLSKDEKEVKIKIWPKAESEDFDYLIITIETQKNLIAKIEAIDPIGNKMIYSFDRIEENVPINPKFFYFSVPPDARIKFETTFLE